MSKYQKGSFGYFIELAKKDGFDNIKDWNEWRKKTGKMPNSTEIKRKEYKDFLDRNGFANACEYNNYIAIRNGYKDINEYNRELCWDSGRSFPISENKNCPQYLGIYIAERKYARKILPIIFEYIKKEMPYGNHGYDFIVKEDIKIDIKGRRLINNKWNFPIGHNETADYFLLIGFNNEYDEDKLKPLHILLIGKNDIIRQGVNRKCYRMEQLHMRSGISISNNKEDIMSITHFQKYDWIDRLGKLI